jgi:hypothetical protein
MDDKILMEFPSKKKARILADRTSKYDEDELYEVFETGSRSEKFEVLMDIAGESMSVIAPTEGKPYIEGLESDPDIRNTIAEFDNIDFQVKVLEGSGDKVVIYDDSNTVINIREVSEQTFEVISEKYSSKSFEFLDDPWRMVEDAEFSVKMGKYNLSDIRNKVLVFNDSIGIESEDYMAVGYDIIEKMVRIGKEGSYRGSYLNGKDVNWSSGKDMAFVDAGEDGVFLLASRRLTNEDRRPSLIEVAQLSEMGGLIGDSISSALFKGDMSKQDILDEFDRKIESGEIDMTIEQAKNILKTEGLKVGDISVKMDKDVVDEIVALDPEPVVVTDMLVKTLKGEFPSYDEEDYFIEKDYDPFTGQDNKVYDLDAGDIEELAKPDAENVEKYNPKVTSLEPFFEALSEHESSKIGEDSWSVKLGEGEEVTVQFVKDVSGSRSKPIWIKGDITEEYVEETNVAEWYMRMNEDEGSVSCNIDKFGHALGELKAFMNDYGADTGDESELSDSEVVDGRVSSLNDARDYFLDMDFDESSEEFFVAIYLDEDYVSVGSEVVSEGDVDSVDFENSDIIRSAESNGAESVVLAHNHPSGNESPSDQDVEATLDLQRDLEGTGVGLIDHLVLADGKVSSMREEGLL